MKKVKCPYCYSYFTPKHGPAQQCDECSRKYELLSLRTGSTFTVGRRRYKIAECSNPVFQPIRHGFAYAGFHHPDLEKLRKKYGLIEAIRTPYKDELKQQLALRDWVCAAWLSGQPSVESPDRPFTPQDAHVETMLTESRTKGNAYYCKYKALATVELASALGWTGRLIGNMGHCIYELWSNQLNKWVLNDSLFNIHYEKNGMPLSAREIREEFYKNRGHNVSTVWGMDNHVISRGHVPPASECYVVYLFNNFFDFPLGDHIHPLLMPRDKHRRQASQSARKWANTLTCKGMVIGESAPYHLEYPINQTEIALIKEKDYLVARLHHNMPNFDHLETRVGRGAWKRTIDQRDYELRWKAGKRPCLLQARCVNSMGVSGPTSHIRIEPAKSR